MTGGVDGTDSLAAALGRIPSGLFVLTVRHGKHETGMLTSWVQQCSFDPPRVTVALRKDREVLEWLEKEAPFVLSILPEGAKHLIAHFGKGFELRESAFEGVNLTRDGVGAPVLQAAHACLACRVLSRVDAGDHLLVIARVDSGAVLNEGKPTVHVRKNGLKY